MGDIACFVIDDSTEQMLKTFVEDIRDKWGNKVYHGYDVRVLPNVPNNHLHSFQLVDKEGGDPVDFIFQQNNGYFIAWGRSPNNMIIFKDSHASFKQVKEEDARFSSRGIKSTKKVTTRKKEVGPPQVPPTHKSSCGVEYQLTLAKECGLNSDYVSLEEFGGLRQSVRIGREALMAAFYEFRKAFVPTEDPHHQEYKKRISKSSISFIQTFPEAFRNNEILKQILDIYNNGGEFPCHLVHLENKWGNFSREAHKLLSEMSQSEELIERKRKFCEGLGLILKKEEGGGKQVKKGKGNQG